MRSSIGAGHNGLTCAYYLASKGLKVAVLEAAGTVGGAAVTDEFLPGFRNSAASYTVSLLQPKVIRDMQLERHGLKVVLRKTDNFLPGDGDYLLSGRNGLTRKEIARHHKPDARSLRPLRRGAGDGRPAAQEMAPARAAQRRPQGQRHPQAAEPRPRHGRPVARRNADRPRFRGPQRGRHPRPPFRGRSRQGAVRVRRRRRQFCLAAVAGDRLRAAPSSVRRGGRRAGRLGPCDRRHGLDHPGDGPRLPRGGRRHPPQHAGRGADRRRDGRARASLRAAKLIARKTVVAGVNPRLLFDRLVPHGAVDADVAAGCTAGSAKARPSG